MKLRWIHFAIFFILGCQRLPVERHCPLTPATDRDFAVYIQSSPGCGHCYVAYRELATLDRQAVSQAILFHADADQRGRLANAYPTIDFVDGSACGDYIPKLFPTVVVLNRSGEVVFRAQGWEQGQIGLLRSAMARANGEARPRSGRK